MYIIRQSKRFPSWFPSRLVTSLEFLNQEAKIPTEKSKIPSTNIEKCSRLQEPTEPIKMTSDGYYTMTLLSCNLNELKVGNRSKTLTTNKKKEMEKKEKKKERKRWQKWRRLPIDPNSDQCGNSLPSAFKKWKSGEMINTRTRDGILRKHTIKRRLKDTKAVACSHWNQRFTHLNSPLKIILAQSYVQNTATTKNKTVVSSPFYFL